jgi:hypothetical protein
MTMVILMIESRITITITTTEAIWLRRSRKIIRGSMIPLEQNISLKITSQLHSRDHFERME